MIQIHLYLLVLPLTPDKALHSVVKYSEEMHRVLHVAHHTAFYDK